MEDDPDGISFTCIRNALIASAFCWFFIIGMAVLGYRLSHLT